MSKKKLTRERLRQIIREEMNGSSKRRLSEGSSIRDVTSLIKTLDPYDWAVSAGRFKVEFREGILKIESDGDGGLEYDVTWM